MPFFSESGFLCALSASLFHSLLLFDLAIVFAQACLPLPEYKYFSHSELRGSFLYSLSCLFLNLFLRPSLHQKGRFFP